MTYSFDFPTGTWEEFENLFDRMVTDRYSPGLSQPAKKPIHPNRHHPGNSAVAKVSRPRVDVVETKDTFVVTAELPGVKKEDISIDLHNGRLLISGELKSSQEHTDGSVRISERCFGSFARTLAVPDGTKPEQIKAAFEDGVLKIEIPKAMPEDQAAKRIAIV